MKEQLFNMPSFYFCHACGNILEMIDSSDKTPVCCGRSMKKLSVGTSDGAIEKHIPVFEIDDTTVTVYVGSTPHPMVAEHHISWIELVTSLGIQRKRIYPGDEAVAIFYIDKREQVLGVFEYCNLHGLWASINHDG